MSEGLCAYYEYQSNQRELKGTEVHGYQPAQLMLGFGSKSIHLDIESTQVPAVLAMEALPEHQYHSL